MYSLNVENLKKKYGSKTVLQNITFQHKEGVLGISGPNGSGKSTLLQCLSSLQRPTSGTITWKNENSVIASNKIRGALGYLAPYLNLYAELTTAENLQFIANLRKNTLEKGEIERLLRFAGLHHQRDHVFGKLSTGQQQRAKLAASLIHDPEILFLDEPCSNLDDHGVEVIRTTVNTYREDGKLVLLASNNMRELDWCDRVYSVAHQSFT